MFSVERHAHFFNFGVICDILFDPGDVSKEGNQCPIYETVFFEVPGSSGVRFGGNFGFFLIDLHAAHKAGVSQSKGSVDNA